MCTGPDQHELSGSSPASVRRLIAERESLQRRRARILAELTRQLEESLSERERLRKIRAAIVVVSAYLSEKRSELMRQLEEALSRYPPRSAGALDGSVSQ